jgi:choline dehydrogenase-like flavoprotein
VCRALKSPQILELSGIGRPDVLSKIGVEVKVPLDGVGENVQEHQFFGCSFGEWQSTVRSYHL